MAPEGVPDREEWAAISFLRLRLPHRSQRTVVFSEKTSTSATWPQSVHTKSKSGMSPSSIFRDVVKNHLTAYGSITIRMSNTFEENPGAGNAAPGQ
jgi:hypothetical protein